MYTIDVAPKVTTLEQHLSLCSIYTTLSDHLDRFTFSVEHLDWKDAIITYNAIRECDQSLLTLTGESLDLVIPDLESKSTALESGFLSSAVTTFIDKIPGLIIKIALAVGAIIVSLIVLLRKKSASVKMDNEIKPITVKGYLGATTPEAYLREFEHTQVAISKLTHLLKGHVERDLHGLSEAVSEAASRLVEYERWSKNPSGSLTRNATRATKGMNAVRLVKEYKRDLESSLSSISGIYSTDIHEGRGVYIADPKSKMLSDSVKSKIENADDVNTKLQRLRNANIDVLLTHFLMTVSLAGADDRASEIHLDNNQVKHLYSIIDTTNHITAELLDKFEAGITELKTLYKTIADISAKIEDTKTGDSNKRFLREILDEVTLSSKAITAMIRDIQSLAIHLIIKY